MLLTISTTHVPATDLGYLLHKNPARIQSAELPFGKAHVFYSEADAHRCTAAVIIEVDPIGLVRGRSGEGGRFADYVNDRPYVASSFLSVAIAEFFSTAMGGRSKERPELAATPIPLEVELPVIRVIGGETFLRSLFEPLGYQIEAERIALDPHFQEWGDSPYLRVRLRQTVRLADLLSHLYVLIPVMDGSKHYFVGLDEVQKLLLRGKDWLTAHPLREEISSRYLRRNRTLLNEALGRLRELEDEPEAEETEEAEEVESSAPERTARLHDLRLDAVRDALVASGASRVLDLGCGEGKLIGRLVRESQFKEIMGMDVSLSVLQRAKRRLHLEDGPQRQTERIKLIHGSLLYRDRRWEGFDAAGLVEVIEHLDEDRLLAMERALFEFAQPRVVVVTTPNREYNARFETLPEGKMRHEDHRFEWSRPEFEEWASELATKHAYRVEFSGIGDPDPQVGAPSQMAVFTRGGRLSEDA